MGLTRVIGKNICICITNHIYKDVLELINFFLVFTDKLLTNFVR